MEQQPGSYSILAQSFSQLNLMRANSPDGFNVGSEPPSYFMIAMMEELGEMAGVLKKLRRGFNKREKLKAVKKVSARIKQVKAEDNITDLATLDFLGKMLEDDVLLEADWRAKLHKKLAQEAADVFTYYDLFCSKTAIDWKREVYEKFNLVNKEMEFLDLFTADPEIHKI